MGRSGAAAAAGGVEEVADVGADEDVVDFIEVGQGGDGLVELVFGDGVEVDEELALAADFCQAATARAAEAGVADGDAEAAGEIEEFVEGGGHGVMPISCAADARNARVRARGGR